MQKEDNEYKKEWRGGNGLEGKCRQKTGQQFRTLKC